MRHTLRAVLASIAFGVLAPAEAGVIDTTGLSFGRQNGFGAGGFETFGQTFTVGGGETFLDYFALYLEKRTGGSGTLNLRGYIGDWDGTRPDNILYTSDTRTKNADDVLQEFLFDPDIVLTSGETYVAFLSIVNLGVQPVSTFAMPVVNNTAIALGNFVSQNSSTDALSLTLGPVWPPGNSDAFFKTSLTVPPVVVAEPGILALMSAGLVILGFLRRRCQALVNRASP